MGTVLAVKLKNRFMIPPPLRPSYSLLGLIAVAAVAAWVSPVRLHAGPAEDVRALTGAQTRVVWVQDAGETACVYSERPTLRLMGLDTDDGKGERAILPGIARYSRPLITDDGTRVMFGDLDKKTVNIVSWDGSGLRTVLENAKFEDVWTDPKDGTDWFYATVPEKRGEQTVDVIRRYRLDNPKVSELVWDKMPIFQFMVSGDGRAASGGSEGGNTPQGILTLPNGDFHARAGGCWPSMAPDNSLRSWVFTGNHRSINFAVTTDRSGKGYTYPVDFDKAPGLTLTRCQELYHPRWTNNIRFLTATAPLSDWSYKAEAKIPNAVAEKVEIYLGKFTEDMKGLERWVKVTDNNRGDYWPNAWIKPPAGPPAWLATSPALAEATDKPAKPDRTSQVFLWNSGADGNQLVDPKTGAIRQCLGHLRDAACYGLNSAMDLTGGAFLPDATAQPFLDTVKSGGAFAFEAVLTPLAEAPSGEGVVLAFADDLEKGNVVLVQSGDQFALRLRGVEGKPLPLVRLPRGCASHVIVSYAPGKLGVFVNGQRVILTGSSEVPVSGWAPQPLIFGDAQRGGHNWPGLIEGMGIFGREIAAAEARQRFEAWKDRTAGRKASVERVIVEAKLVGTCPPADPKGIAPYKRCLSVQQFEVVKTIEGKLDDKRINVAQWSVLDARVVAEYLALKAGQTSRLALERWVDHPEQESERMISGDFEESQLFYQVREASAPPAVVAAAAPAASDDFSGAWHPVPGQASRRRLAEPVFIQGRENPQLFASVPGAQLDAAGQEITLEHTSLTEIANEGTLRLGGSGAVTAATVMDAGSGYTSAPALTLSGGGGQGASAEASMAVSRVELTSLGCGFTSVPTVKLGRPDLYGGRQATAVAEVNKGSGALVEIRVTDPGTGYQRAPQVTISGGGGSDAVAVATLSVAEVFVVHGGSGYTSPPAVSLKGDGEGTVVKAALQRMVLRFTAPHGNAQIRNAGTIEQDGAAIIFDWAAPQNNNGNRGLENSGTWVMNNGAVIQFLSSTGRPFWGCKFVNKGTFGLLGGSRIGTHNMQNSGTFQLGAGAMIAHGMQSGSEAQIANAGQVQVIGSSAHDPAQYGQVNLDGATDSRAIENGVPDGSSKAVFTIGDGRDASVFNVVGGQVKFDNNPGAATLINPGATLALITNDNGSRHPFTSRQAFFNNGGDLTLAGVLKVQGNCAGFTGIGNKGRLIIHGEKAGIERLPNSGGPGAAIKADFNSSQIFNLPGGELRGSGTFTYTNSTGSDEGRSVMLVNHGRLAPGIDQPGRLSFNNVNVRFGGPPAQREDPKMGPPPSAEPGLLRIQIVSPSKYSSLEVSGDSGNGAFDLVEGTANVLDVVTSGPAVPHGKYRIVTAKSVKGTFAVLQLNGKSPTTYTVNYLPDGIEVVFP